jgi:retron-type reverse transcriptase
MRTHKPYSLQQSPLYMLANHRKLAALLSVSLPDLRKLGHSDARYREFDIPKKTGGTRLVENPPRPLKLVQARLARLLSRIAPPDYLFCPVKGRSYVNNAAQHRNNRVVRCLDVRKYFPNTAARRVYWFFRHVLRCEPDIAETLCKLATHRDHLPTGSPLSPIMAYFAHYDVWEKVAKIANANGLTLTIYIDDVTISGHRVSERTLWAVKKSIHASGLRYHKEKRFIDSPAEITGAITRAGSLYPPNRQLKKLHRARLDPVTLSPSADAKIRKGKLDGLLGQIGQIRRLNRSSAA